MKPFPVKTGWLQLQGDGNDPDPEAHDVKTNAGGKRLRQVFWAFVEDGFVIGLEHWPKDFDPKGLTCSESHRGLLWWYEEQAWFKKVQNILWETMWVGVQECKFNGILVGVSEPVPLLPLTPTNDALVAGEKVLVDAALNKIHRRLKLTLRAWPFCGHYEEGSVNLAAELDRENKTIHGVWHCWCGQ